MAILLTDAIVLDSKIILMTQTVEKLSIKIHVNRLNSWKDSDYRFILPKTQLNKNSLIPWLLTVRAGSELNLITKKFTLMVNLKVILDVSYWRLDELLFRNDHFRRLDCKSVFKSRSRTRICNQFSQIVLARRGSEMSLK